MILTLAYIRKMVAAEWMARSHSFQVGLDQQTVTLVCTNRRRQFLLDTGDSSLTV